MWWTEAKQIVVPWCGVCDPGAVKKINEHITRDPGLNIHEENLPVEYPTPPRSLAYARVPPVTARSPTKQCHIADV